MKVTCCCFTCIIGEDKNDEKEETSHLLHPEVEEEDERPPIHDKQPYSRSTSAVSSASTVRGLSTESTEPASESADGGSKDKFSKAVGVLKKYNVMSTKYNTKELQRQLSSPAKLRLKVGFKISTRSSSVKISVVEAHDIMPILQLKGLPEAGPLTEDQGVIIQVRTKIMHSEVRGHSKKYEMHGGITGALKLRNETIHTMDLDEFKRSKIRFRLYYVMKHQRDKLLGEYTLDVSTLNMDAGSTATQTVLDLYDPSLVEPEPGIKSPEVVAVPNRMLSFDSQTSIDKDTSLSVTPKIQRQAKIRQDSEARLSAKKEKGSVESIASEKSEEESSSKKSISKAFKSLRSGLSREHSTAPKEKEHSIEQAVEQLSTMEKLKADLSERGEKVGELEETTAAMADSASNFSALSVKLKEKYKAQAEGKKSKSAES